MNKQLIFSEIQDSNEKIDKIAKLIRHLPEENFCLLRILISHLYRIVAHADLNKMTSSNGKIAYIYQAKH